MEKKYNSKKDESKYSGVESKGYFDSRGWDESSRGYGASGRDYDGGNYGSGNINYGRGETAKRAGDAHRNFLSRLFSNGLKYSGGREGIVEPGSFWFCMRCNRNARECICKAIYN